MFWVGIVLGEVNFDISVLSLGVTVIDRSCARKNNFG